MIFKQTHKTMLDAKGNQFTLYDEQLEDTVHHPLFFETKICHVIKNEEFEIYYQPKFNVEKNTFGSMKALIRWHELELGFVSPNDFIPFVEEQRFNRKN